MGECKGTVNLSPKFQKGNPSSLLVGPRWAFNPLTRATQFTIAAVTRIMISPGHQMYIPFKLCLRPRKLGWLNSLSSYFDIRCLPNAPILMLIVTQPPLTMTWQAVNACTKHWRVNVHSMRMIHCQQRGIRGSWMLCRFARRLTQQL